MMCPKSSWNMSKLYFLAVLFVGIGGGSAMAHEDPPQDETTPDIKPEKADSPAPRRPSRPELPPRTPGTEPRIAEGPNRGLPPTRLPRVAIEVVQAPLGEKQAEKSLGTIVIELEDKKAPISTANFLAYVDEHFYDGTIFHRILSTPRATIGIIQGGGYTTPSEKKEPGRKAIRCEATNGLKNVRGTVAMARTKEPNSATCQFFINTTDNPDLDHPGPENWGNYGAAVFGKVVEGMDVVDKIKDLKTRSQPMKPDEQSQPMEIVRIKSIKRVTIDRAKNNEKAGDPDAPPTTDSPKSEDQESAPPDHETEKPESP